MRDCVNRFLRRIAALTACVLLAPSCAPPVRAEDAPAFSGAAETSAEISGEISAETPESSPSSIRVTVRMEEEGSGTGVIPPLQLSCPAGTTAAGLLVRLRNFAYLESFVLVGGTLLSIGLEEGGEERLLSGTDGWDLFINETLIERGSLPVLNDGDEVCWRFEAAENASRQPSHEVAAASTATQWNERYAEALIQAGAWLKNNFRHSATLVSLGAAGISVEYQSIEKLMEAAEAASREDAVDLALLILSATFCGISATNMQGKDLLADLSAYPGLAGEGTLAAACALIAADSNAYPLPEDGINTRESLLEILLAAQNADGGFSAETGGSSSPFLTAASLVALSRYRQSGEVDAASERARAYLAGVQLEDGSMPGEETASAALNTSFAIAALCAMNVPVADPDSSAGNSLLEALLSYQTQNGGFCPEPGEPADESATAAAVLALAAAKNNRNIFVLRTPLAESEASSQPAGDGTESPPPAETEPSRSETPDGAAGAEEPVSPLAAGISAALAVAAACAIALLLRRRRRRR